MSIYTIITNIRKDSTVDSVNNGILYKKQVKIKLKPQQHKSHQNIDEKLVQMIHYYMGTEICIKYENFEM
jgi:hypothetical protein